MSDQSPVFTNRSIPLPLFFLEKHSGLFGHMYVRFATTLSTATVVCDLLTDRRKYATRKRGMGSPCARGLLSRARGTAPAEIGISTSVQDEDGLARGGAQRMESVYRHEVSGKKIGCDSVTREHMGCCYLLYYVTVPCERSGCTQSKPLISDELGTDAQVPVPYFYRSKSFYAFEKCK